DKDSYRSGETMKVRLDPRFDGKATLAVVGEAMHEIRTVDVMAAGTEVTIPVKAEWGPGAYLVALAHRPPDAAAKRMPGRAVGTAWFEIDREARRLEVDFSPPRTMRPGETLSLPIRVAGLEPGEEARVTVAAV